MDTLLALVKDTPANVLIVAIVCIAIVLTALIVAISLPIFSYQKNRRLRKEQDAKRTKEKEEKWFSLRKEYESEILSYLKSKDTQGCKNDSSVIRNPEYKDLCDACEVKGKDLHASEDAPKEGKYISELRACIAWIDEQRS